MKSKQTKTRKRSSRRLHGVVSRAERELARKEKLREKVLQLSNDLSESMPMGRWTRKDLMAAITFWNDQACEAVQILAAYRSNIITKTAELLQTAQRG